MLAINSISINYRKRSVIHDASFDVKSGIHVLLGPNGAGKTTILKAIAGILPIASGTISFSTEDSCGAKAHNIGYLPQENLPRSSFTVEEFLSYIAWLHKIPRRKTQAEVTRVLQLTNTPNFRAEKIKTLSGGTRRRVGIAASLIGSPQLIVLDEPSVGLDIIQRREMCNALETIAATIPILLTTHIVDDIIDVATDVTVLSHGKVAYSGSLEDMTNGDRTARAVEKSYAELASNA